ncbi:hypothetical protein M1446_05000 [Candidatus Dependentiae bacterium]|nr:hypothetical protein [Candidatus Dependentiae bacterium]
MSARSFILKNCLAQFFISFLIINAIEPNVQQNKEKNNNIKVINNIIEDFADDFFKVPISFTRTGMKNFMTNIYNSNQYLSCLPHKFNHISDFLKYGLNTPYPRTYLKSVFDLFGQRLKGSIFVNSYSFCEFIEDVHGTLKQYMSFDKDMAERKAVVKEQILEMFANHSNLRKEDPEKFLDKLSGNILYSLDNQLEDRDTSLDRAQQSIYDFLEISLNKLVWNPADQNYIWESVRLLSYQLENLIKIHAIRDYEVLDKLYWSIIYRFCYFLDMFAGELKPECYAIINNDLEQAKLPLLTLQEQEFFMTTKLDYLKNAIFIAQAKLIAKDRGLITQEISKTKKNNPKRATQA